MDLLEQVFVQTKEVHEDTQRAAAPLLRRQAESWGFSTRRRGGFGEAL